MLGPLPCLIRAGANRQVGKRAPNVSSNGPDSQAFVREVSASNKEWDENGEQAADCSSASSSASFG